MEFRSSVRIAAPIGVVWPILADVRRWPAWAETFELVEPQTDEPLGPGAIVLIRQPRLPPGYWTVTDWRPFESFAWATRRPGVVVTAHHELLAQESGCIFAQRLRFRGPLGILVAAFGRKLIRAYMRTEAAGLKLTSEAAVSAATSGRPTRASRRDGAAPV
jgi:hypothetical protein